MAAIGATVADDVDVLRKVAFIVFALVGDGNNGTVLGSDDSRDAVIGRVVITRLIDQSMDKNDFAATCWRRIGKFVGLVCGRYRLQRRINHVAFCGIVCHMGHNPQVVGA